MIPIIINDYFTGKAAEKCSFKYLIKYLAIFCEKLNSERALCYRKKEKFKYLFASLAYLGLLKILKVLISMRKQLLRVKLLTAPKGPQLTSYPIT